MSGYNKGTASTRKPHNHLAGYVFERKHSLGHIVCLIAEKAGIDSDAKYVVVIENQGLIGPSFSSVPKARAFVNSEITGESSYDWR